MVKILLPQQQHQSLLQWMNSLATAHYGFDMMDNALMLTTEDRRMGDSLKAMDRVKWTTGMLMTRMTADEIIDFISEKMTLQTRKEAQHPDRGGRGMFRRRMQTSPNLPPLSRRTSRRTVAAHPMPVEAHLRVHILRVECRRWTPSWRKCTGCSPPARRTQPASGRSRAAGVRRRCHSAINARSTADQTARAAAMSATGRIVITAMITCAAR